VTATIDPRIEERRSEVEREAGRRRWRIVLIVVGVLVAIGAAFLVVHSPFLDVDRVKVTGASHVSERAVRGAAGIDRGAPVLFVDTAAARHRVERLPWVASAGVSRRWPGTVAVTVHERVPVAYSMRDASRGVLIDGTGFVIAEITKPPVGLVEIYGLEHFPRVGQRGSRAAAGTVVGRLPRELAARVAAIDVSDGVTLHLRKEGGSDDDDDSPEASPDASPDDGAQDGGEVRLCTTDDVTAKAAAAMAVMARLGDAPFTYIDVCVPAAPASR
jgi:cell division protein FtsQ